MASHCGQKGQWLAGGGTTTVGGVPHGTPWLMQILCLELGEDNRHIQRHIQWMNIHWRIGRPQEKKTFLHEMAKVKKEKEPIDGVT